MSRQPCQRLLPVRKKKTKKAKVGQPPARFRPALSGTAVPPELSKRPRSLCPFFADDAVRPQARIDGLGRSGRWQFFPRITSLASRSARKSDREETASGKVPSISRGAKERDPTPAP